ncbi:MAG TPA: acetyl-CoA carboxylase carboxyltransferase subunit beta, partial [Candidatus Eisenbacteria bacterium]|nr:acetyl-CoA carboxylase carboxyltransferase subunit beta [Candidatus Eisenbacteria bacterium]
MDSAEWFGPTDVAASGCPLPVLPLTCACPGCGLVADAERLRWRLYVCDCGNHFRMSAEAWIALLASPGSWHERWDDLRPRDQLRWAEPRPYQGTLESALRRGMNEAVRTGPCVVERHPVWLAAFDFGFVGGTLGVVAGERLASAIECAADERAPFVLVTASGGARMQEGTLALMQMAKVNAALHALERAGVLFLSILTDPTFGGTAASVALLGDVNIAEPAAAIGFTGARVIRRATHADLPAGFQTAEFQLAHGQVDIVVSRLRLRQT